MAAPARQVQEQDGKEEEESHVHEAVRDRVDPDRDELPPDAERRAVGVRGAFYHVAGQRVHGRAERDARRAATGGAAAGPPRICRWERESYAAEGVGGQG